MYALNIVWFDAIDERAGIIFLLWLTHLEQNKNPGVVVKSVNDSRSGAEQAETERAGQRDTDKYEIIAFFVSPLCLNLKVI